MCISCKLGSVFFNAWLAQIRLCKIVPNAHLIAKIALPMQGKQ
jgi:hypothetical protein